MHGGSVAAKSDGPGTGSEFIVRLPLLVESPPLLRLLAKEGVSGTSLFPGYILTTQSAAASLSPRASE